MSQVLGPMTGLRSLYMSVNLLEGQLECGALQVRAGWRHASMVQVLAPCEGFPCAYLFSFFLVVQGLAPLPGGPAGHVPRKGLPKHSSALVTVPVGGACSGSRAKESAGLKPSPITLPTAPRLSRMCCCPLTAFWLTVAICAAAPRP